MVQKVVGIALVAFGLAAGAYSWSLVDSMAGYYTWSAPFTDSEILAILSGVVAAVMLLCGVTLLATGRRKV